MGLGMPSLSILLLAQSPEHRRGADSAALQIADVTGSALCVGGVGILIAAATAGQLSLPAAVLCAVVFLAALAALGALTASRARPLGGSPESAAAPSAPTLAGP
jgi:tellurite resistance protein TehA-like permease